MHKLSLIFLLLAILTLAFCAPTEGTIVDTEKNLVTISEKPTLRTADQVISTKQPSIIFSEFSKVENDPKSEVIDANSKMKTEVQELNFKENKELKTQLKNDQKSISEKLVTLHDLLTKYQHILKLEEAKVMREEIKDKVQQESHNIEVLRNKIAEVTKLEKESQLKKDSIAAKIESIKSEESKYLDIDNRTVLSEQMSSKTFEVKAQLVKKSQIFSLVETEKKVVERLMDEINREKSPKKRNELEEVLQKKQENLIQMHKHATVLEKSIKENKQVIRELSNNIKEIKKDLEIEKIEGSKCSAYTVNPNRKYCIKYNEKGTCEQWRSIYGTEG